MQAVRQGDVQAIERDESAGAGLVLDDDRRPQRLGEVGRDQPREDVVAAARARTHDHPHGLARVEGFSASCACPGDPDTVQQRRATARQPDAA